MMYRQSLVPLKQCVRGMEGRITDRMFKYDQPTMLILMQISMAGLASDVTVVSIHAKMR